MNTLYSALVTTVLVATLAMVTGGGWAAEESGNEPVVSGEDFIAVKNPVLLPPRLPAQRVPLGPGYKPSIALLKSGELLVVAFTSRRPEGAEGFEEYFISWRSPDAGVTWSGPEELQGITGREPFLTVLSDGTLLLSNHLLSQDINNKEDFWYSHIRRSTDEGHTWESHRIGKEDGFPPDGKGTATDRQAVELPDGTVLLGVSTGMNAGLKTYMWRSTDFGKTWEKSTECDNMGWRDVDGFFSNSETFRLPSGKLLHINRVESHRHPIEGQEESKPAPGWDQTDRSMLWESTDNGVTWRKVRDMGDYGEMYPQLLQLEDGRILYNFTVRDLKYPLGIQAIINYDEGETWDFAHDRIIVESGTPEGKASGGGYGNTIQLPDSTLLTAYSYRGEDNGTHVEVVRWNLPPVAQTEE